MWIAILIILWLMTLLILNRIELYFYRFIVGCIGLFFILLLFYGNEIEGLLLFLVSNILASIDGYFPYFKVFKDVGMINVTHTNESIISFYINYECTGIIETLVYTSLIMFYPIYSFKDKTIRMIIGNIAVVLANVIRILVILISLHYLGSDYFFVIHTVIGRIIFFFLVVTLYYYMFTKKHINIQKIGEMENGNTV